MDCRRRSTLTWHLGVPTLQIHNAERLGKKANELLVQLEVLLEIYIVTIFK